MKKNIFFVGAESSLSLEMQCMYTIMYSLTVDLLVANTRFCGFLLGLVVHNYQQHWIRHVLTTARLLHTWGCVCVISVSCGAGAQVDPHVALTLTALKTKTPLSALAALDTSVLSLTTVLHTSSSATVTLTYKLQGNSFPSLHFQFSRENHNTVKPFLYSYIRNK